MKRLFGNVALVLCALLVILRLANAAELKEARVTQVVKDVKLLPQQANPRPATVKDLVREGTAVRTGTQSRSELTFNDLTITRLGANTIFSFEEGTRMMDLRDGAILFQVPKGSGGATIRTTAVTAAITGTTGIGEFHPAGTAAGPHPFSKWLCLEGTFHLILPNGQKVELGPGKMVTTDGKNFSKVLSFDIGQVMKTSLLVNGYDNPLPSLPLIQIEQEKQLALITNRTPITNTSTLLDPANIIDVVDQGMAAQESPTVTPTPSITPTPSTPTPTPGKFGALTVIASSDPYVITSGTRITTDPSITTNGQTDFGKIYRDPAQDGPLSAFIFGSTSAFDTASGFDAEIIGDNSMGGAGFKFTSLQLTGDPTISTANGPPNLGLIAVDGITSGGPGGVLTFAGIHGLLLATQNGSINLGPEISFSGLHDITFYARGAGSMLTLASDVSTTNKIRLYGEGGIQLSSNLSTQDLIAFTNGDFDFTAGSIDAETISIISGGDLTFSLGTPLSFNTKTFLLQAEGNIHVNDSLEIIEDSLSPDADLNISLVAGSENILVEGDLSLTTNPGDVITGANIVVTSGGDTTIGGALTLLVDNSNGGQIGTGGNISFTTGGNLTADSVDALVNNRDGGSIDSGGNITFNIAGTLTTTGDASFVSTNRNDGLGGGTIGSNVVLTLNVGSVSVGGFLLTDISTNAGGNIPSATLNVEVAGNLTTQSFAQIDIQNTGFNAFGGPFIGGGTIGADATLNLTVNNISTGDTLDVEIVNRGDGHIGGDAVMNIAASGNINVQSDAFVEVVNTADLSGATEVPGGTIDGNAQVNFSAGNIHTQGILELGILNNDQRFFNGAGSIGGDAAIIFSAANVSATGFFNLVINNAQGSIGGGSSIDAHATGISTDDTFFAHILNETGQIGQGASVSVATTGAISVGSDAIFEIANPGGTIGGDATMNVNAANITTGATLFASINNTGGGSIGGNAVISMNVSGNTTVTTDATIQIYGSDGAASAAININGGNYDVGGTFFNVIDGNGTIAFNNASVHADVLKVGAFGTNGVLNIGGGTLSADTTLKLYASGSNGQLNFISDVTLGGNSAKILAANSITILDGVVVTVGNIADENPADVFTNHANYSSDFGGNDSTTGTFAGSGANDPQPLPSAPPFDNSARPRTANGPSTTTSHPRPPSRTPVSHSRTPSATHVTSTNRPHGDLKVGSKKSTGPAIKVSDSGQLLSLLEGAPDTGGKITVPASTDTRDKGNSGRVDGAARLNADRGAVNVPPAPSSQGRSLR